MKKGGPPLLGSEMMPDTILMSALTNAHPITAVHRLFLPSLTGINLLLIHRCISSPNTRFRLGGTKVELSRSAQPKHEKVAALFTSENLPKTSTHFC